MYLGDSKNTFGTIVSEFKCDICLQSYTVCPKVEIDIIGHWNNCLSASCESYDLSRDADKFFDSNIVPIVGITKLKAKGK